MMQVPMGMLGDKGGIRLAFMLNATSTIFYWGCIAIVGMASRIALEVGLLILIGSQHHFPLWGFYLSPMFILLGGGPWATGTLVFAAISDSVKPEQRHAPTLIIPNPRTDMNILEQQRSRSWRRYQESRTSSGQLLAQ